MARIPFPDAASRWAVDTAGHPIAGHSYTVYTDVTGLHLADIVADVNGAPGAAIAGSVVTTDAFGYLPLWWGPADGSARLYISDGTISPWPVDAINRYRIDGIDTRVTTLETSPGLTAPVQSVAGRIGAIVLAAADVTGVETPAGSQAKANAVATAAAQALADHTGASTSVHGITDTAALETQTGAQTKATTARNAAIAASDPVGTAAAAVNVHNAATTAVHGITDTSVLETLSGAQAKADAAAAASIPLVQRAAPLGVATLGADGKLSGAQIPAISLVDYLGVAADETAMLALDGQPGDFTIRTDVSSTWVLTGGDPTVLADWTELAYPTAAVISVAGKTGSVTVTKADVGLGSADNTADTAKPVSTAQQAALDLKAPVDSPTFTGTVNGITKAMVGLAAADNTHDIDKPISTPTQTALDAKAPLASPTFTGTVSGVTAAMVGLGSVDNVADVDKPVSTAQAASIATRAPANGVYVATDLQWGYSGGSDLTTPITNILAAIPTNGGTLLIPDGSWTATGPFTWKSGVRWLGAGRAASRLTVTGAFLTWSATCHDVSVESLRITCSGGHMFNSPGGNAFYIATIRDCLLIQNSTGYGVFQHDGLDYDKVIVENCQIIRPAGSTVAAWYVRNATGAANCNTWRNLRFDSNNSTTPCIYVECNDTSGRYAYDNTIEDILSEQSPGGVVEVYSARNLRIANVVDWDTSVTCTSDLVKIGKSSATGASPSRNVYIEKCGRRGGSGFGYGSTYDVNLIATQVKSATVMELHNSGVSGKISFASGDYVTLVGAPTGGIAWTGQPSTATHYFGGSAVFEQGIYLGSAKDTSGTGTPEGAVTGNPGDVFRRRDGASGSTFYIKSSGTGNTGWVAAGAGGSGGTGDASTNTTVSVDSEVALFSGTAGKTLKRATGTGLATLTAGVLSVTTAPAGVLVGTTATQTLTATRVRPRVTSAASSATPTPNADTDDQFQLTALAANATFAAPAGTPTDGQPLIIRIKDNGTARTLAWTGTAYRPIGVSLPTATVATKTTYLGLRYNAADTIWDVLAVSLQA